MATRRVYDTNAQLVDGYTKSLWSAFGSEPAVKLSSAFLKAIYVLPPVVAVIVSVTVLAALGTPGLCRCCWKDCRRETNAATVLPDAAAQPLSIIAFGAFHRLVHMATPTRHHLVEGQTTPGATS